MLDMEEINRAIAELEAGKTTMAACSKLADLYAIRDHVRGTDEPIYIREYSQASTPIVATNPLGNYGDSDFLVVISGKVPADAWGIMDDLMDTLQVTYPRVYDSVMRRLRQL